VLSKRFCNTPKELATNIRSRLDALAMAHELILPRSASEEADATAESARLNDLLRKILSAYDFQDSKGHRRLVMSGPPIAVGPRVSRFLCTNSPRMLQNMGLCQFRQEVSM
jgi:two-component sensor histidine kinase